MSRRSGPAIAYVDESVSDRTRLYTMTAVIIDRERLRAVRTRLESMANIRNYMRGRDMTSESRDAVVNYLGAYPGVQMAVTAHAPLDIEMGGQRTARQRCLAELVARIAPNAERQAGDDAYSEASRVKFLVLPNQEGSGGAQNRKLDQRTLAIMRDSGAADQNVQLRHADRTAQPGLWAADVLGAEVRASLEHDDPRRLIPVVDKTQIVEARTMPALVVDPSGQDGPRTMPYTGRLPSNGLQDRLDLVTAQAGHDKITDELRALREAKAGPDQQARQQHGAKLAGTRNRYTQSERQLEATRNTAAKRAPMENYLRERPSTEKSNPRGR